MLLNMNFHAPNTAREVVRVKRVHPGKSHYYRNGRSIHALESQQNWCLRTCILCVSESRTIIHII